MSSFRVPTLNDAGEFTGSALEHIKAVAQAAAGTTGSGGSTATRVQDTGWRRIESEGLSNGAVFFRRVGNLVAVTVRGGSWDTATVKAAANRQARGQAWGDLVHRARLAINIPNGFQTQSSVAANVLTDDGESVGMLIMSPPSDGNRLTFRGFRNGAVADVSGVQLRFPTMFWFTNDTWPGTLPGVQA